jgi:hypothetical protein
VRAAARWASFEARIRMLALPLPRRRRRPSAPRLRRTRSLEARPAGSSNASRRRRRLGRRRERKPAAALTLAGGARVLRAAIMQAGPQAGHRTLTCRSGTCPLESDVAASDSGALIFGGL